MTNDPLRLLWDRLDAGGYGPRGKPYEFRSRCPAHNGDNPTSLSVGIGADGRAVVWCHAHQCSAEEITAALGLSVHDLFPAGHHRARRLSQRPLRRADFTGAALSVANVLYALERVEERWQLMLTSLCPYCGSPGAWLQASSDGRVDADCPEGCDESNYLQALLARLHAEEAGK